MDGDGAITPADARQLLRASVGLERPADRLKTKPETL